MNSSFLLSSEDKCKDSDHRVKECKEAVDGKKKCSLIGHPNRNNKNNTFRKKSGSKTLVFDFSRGPGGFKKLRGAGRNHFHLSWYLSVPGVTSYGQKTDKEIDVVILFNGMIFIFFLICFLYSFPTAVILLPFMCSLETSQSLLQIVPNTPLKYHSEIA